MRNENLDPEDLGLSRRGTPGPVSGVGGPGRVSLDVDMVPADLAAWPSAAFSVGKKPGPSG